MRQLQKEEVEEHSGEWNQALYQLQLMTGQAALRLINLYRYQPESSPALDYVSTAWCSDRKLTLWLKLRISSENIRKELSTRRYLFRMSSSFAVMSTFKRSLLLRYSPICYVKCLWGASGPTRMPKAKSIQFMFPQRKLNNLFIIVFRRSHISNIKFGMKPRLKWETNGTWETRK